MIRRFSILCISILLLFISCETDLDVLADWKETTVVYGLLNQDDSVQYVKINKAFLGHGNAMEMAKVADSSHYKELQVVMERWYNGSLKDTFVLSRDYSITKLPGEFYTSPNVLYKTNTRGVRLNSSAEKKQSEYRLLITNTRSGHVVKGKTLLVQNVSGNVYPTHFVNPAIPVKMTWQSGKNGRLYSVVIRFNYWDFTSAQDSVANHIDWTFQHLKSSGLDGNETMELTFMGEGFYRNIKAKIKDHPSVIKRKPGTIDFIFSIGSEDLSTYLEVNKPSTGILQEKPYFSNIENGIGLFSSRLNHNAYNKALTFLSLEELCSGIHTQQLRFCNPAKGASQCPCQ